MTIQLAFLLSATIVSTAHAGPPAYTYDTKAAGQYFGREAGWKSKKFVHDNPTTEGAYCNSDPRKLVARQMEKLPITPPVKGKKWEKGEDYGDYLHNFFSSACQVFTGKTTISDALEDCDAWKDDVGAYSAGIEAGENALTERQAVAGSRVSREYCNGESNAAELARKAILDVLKTETPPYPKDNYNGGEKKEFIRGFVHGLCSEFAGSTCANYKAWAKFLAPMETVIQQGRAAKTPPRAEKPPTRTEPGQDSGGVHK